MTQAEQTGPDTGARAGADTRHGLLVLGMHRSGTSALTGTLDLLGCATPVTQIPQYAENPKGFFETPGAVHLNDAILKSNASRWDDWLAFDPAWYAGEHPAAFQPRAVALLTEEFGAAPLLAFKDPRNCRLVPFWCAALTAAGYRPGVIHTHRHPREVARSLQARNGFAPDFGLLLWLRHVLAAEADSRDIPRVFTSYDHLMRDWRAVAARIGAGLNLEFPHPPETVAEAIGAFLSADLRHAQEAPDTLARDPRISEWVRTGFAILDRWATTGEDPGDHATLDRIRQDFDAAVPAFRGLVQTATEASGALHKVTLALEAEQAKTARAGAELYQAVRARQFAETELAEARDRLRDADDRLRQSRAEIATGADRRAALQDRIAAQSRQMQSRDQALGLLARDLAAAETSLANLRQARDQLALAYQTICTSSAWRLTAPLRRLADLIRRR